MNKDIVLDTKKKLGKLYSIAKSINQVWNNPLETMCCTLLQNAAFSSEVMNHKHAWKEIMAIEKALWKLNNHHDYHFITWLYMEYNIIVFEAHIENSAKLEESSFDEKLRVCIIGPINL